MISLREAQLGNPQSFISEQEAALGQQGDLDRLNNLYLLHFALARGESL